jgi:hypothetical protein
VKEPFTDDPTVESPSSDVGTVQIAAILEFAGIPDVAGPPIVPLTMSQVVTVLLELTTTWIPQSTNPRGTVLLFTIVKEQIPVEREQETSCAERYPSNALGIEMGELVELVV